MILSAHTIRLITFPEHNNRRIFEPWSERSRFNGMTYGLGPAGYDVRIRENLDMEPGSFALGSIIEHIKMPNRALGIVHDKSTLARLGIALQNTVIEPGWEGFLTVEISNHGSQRIRIPQGCPIAQIILHMTDFPAEAYQGKYQNQSAAPVEAIFEPEDEQ